MSDGAWWPRTAVLQAELPGLDLAIHALTGSRIARTAYSLDRWAKAPRVVRTALGMTKLGWFEHAERPENIDLSLTDYTILVLTVIPPGTDTAQAEQCLRDAARPLLVAPTTGTRLGRLG